MSPNWEPEDYESFGLYLFTRCKIVVSDLQKQYMNYFWNREIFLRNTFVTVFILLNITNPNDYRTSLIR